MVDPLRRSRVEFIMKGSLPKERPGMGVRWNAGNGEKEHCGVIERRVANDVSMKHRQTST